MLMSKPARLLFCRVWAPCLSAVSPLLVMTWYLEYSRSHRTSSASLDTAAFIVCLVLGTTFLFCTPMKLPARILAFLAYNLAMGLILMLLSFSFVCFRFGACL